MKWFPKFYIAGFLFLFLQNIYGQYSEIIRTGRPGQAIGAFTVGKNILQFQQGIELASFDAVDSKPLTVVNNNVIRYGISETFEISTLIDFSYSEIKHDSYTETSSGISTFHLGGRIHITNQKGVIPSTCFQSRVTIPIESNTYRSNHLLPVNIIVANWSLPKNMGIATNWIYRFNAVTQKPVGGYVCNFSFPIIKKFSGFIESYGSLENHNFQNRFDGGFAYLMNNDLQLDTSFGYGNNQNITDYFISFGVSWRVKTNN